MNPSISVIVANYNGEAFLAESLRSILAQSFAGLEVLLVDDMSTDRSLEIAEAFAAQDARVRILRAPENRGPAAARNLALRAARGAWIAVVDSDDFIHPERLARLLEAAEAAQADIVADDQLVFENEIDSAPKTLLRGALATAASWITAEQYVHANGLFGKSVALGYLKPLIRASLLRQHGIEYNESLQNAEDYDLILRLLARGARFRLVPELLYFYRRHGASISYRLSKKKLLAMAQADGAFREWAGPETVAPLRKQLDARLASIDTAAAVEKTIAQFKARAIRQALASLAARPSAIPIIARLAAPAALLARLRRRGQPAAQKTSLPAAQKICVLSRQRLVKNSNGSTAYLLSLCTRLRESGYRLQLVCPTPAMFGRLPVLRVAGAGEIFDSVAIRGAIRIGALHIVLDPRVFFAAGLSVLDRLARRAGVSWFSALARPAPYAVGVPWTREDFFFVAKASRGNADVVLADYGFLTPGITFASRPGAASAVLMHDLFSSRRPGFAAIGAADSVTELDSAQEAALLAQARLVIAIQAEEAQAVRRLLPQGPSVAVAPMAVTPLSAPQPGEGGGLLFVGSSTAPNVDAMRWFLAAIWPLVRVLRPNARLTIAGSVCGKLAVPGKTSGVTLAGRVADLAPLYRRADLVISPLRAGSGLKIKLVEALAHGKPVVATAVTTQGVDEIVGGAVALADAPQDFASEILRLLAHRWEREALARAALDVARRNFSPAASYAGVIAHLRAQLGAASAPAKSLMRHGGGNVAEPERITAGAPVLHFDAMNFVTIIVPALNEERYIEPCLTSLVAQCAGENYEILVLDGGSTDATRAIVTEFCARHPMVALHHNPKRLQSAAVNLGSRLAAPQSRIMIRADAHAHYAPDFVKNCAAALRHSGATSVVVPMRTQALAGAFQQSAIAAAQSSRLGNGGSAHRANAVSGFVEHGHHAAFDLAFFRALGGYDESFTHNEDAELDARAARAGGRIFMCAEAVVTYYPRSRLDRLALQYYRHGRGRARTLAKHKLRPRLRQVVPVGALAGCVAGVATAPFVPGDASLALLYPALCLSWGVLESLRRRQLCLVIAGLALMTMHLAWAVGFLSGFGRGGSIARRKSASGQRMQAADITILPGMCGDATVELDGR